MAEDRAKKLLENAKKSAKKSFFHKPDFFEAARFAEEAGNLYKSKMKLKEAGEAMTQAAEYHTANDSYKGAGRLYEEAANLTVRQNKFEEAAELLEKAQLNLRMGSQASSAGQMLTKNGKIIMQTSPASAVGVFKLAVEIFGDEDLPQFADDSFQYLAVALFRSNKWDEALQELPKRIEIARKLKRPDTANKTILTMVIIHLHKDNVEGAQELISQYLEDDTFSNSEDCMIASQLISAVIMGDEDSLHQVLKAQYLTFLPVDINKLSKTIKVRPGGEDLHSELYKGISSSSSSSSSSGVLGRGENDEEGNEDEENPDLGIL